MDTQIGDSLTSARQYQESARIARARFERDGEVEQGEWADKYVQAVRLHLARVVEMGGTVPPEMSAQVEAGQTMPVPAPKKARCVFWKHIKKFFAIAREHGLDTNAKEACRAAIGMFLGRRILSREDLTGPEWELCANGIKGNRLFW